MISPIHLDGTNAVVEFDAAEKVLTITGITELDRVITHSFDLTTTKVTVKFA